MLCASIRDLAERYGLVVVEKPGRFREERNFELWLSGSRLLVAKCFNGRPPYYARWIEVFAVNNLIETGEGTFVFAGSALERELLEALAGELKGGELMYIEYGYDKETERLLRLGLPPHVTRLGFLLLRNGFTVLKDFYIPEGFMEGEAKLQGEKPASADDERRHLARIVEEVERALPRLKRGAGEPAYRSWMLRALERAEAILQGLEPKLSFTRGSGKL